MKELILSVADDQNFFRDTRRICQEHHYRLYPFEWKNDRCRGATNLQRLAGTLDINASVKAARFVRFCDAFNIPLLTLCGCTGISCRA